MILLENNLLLCRLKQQKKQRKNWSVTWIRRSSKRLHRQEVRIIQREIKGHLRALNLIFRPGKETQSEERVWEAKELKSTIIPVLSLLIKDHKQLNPDGSPKSHPVCGASRSINGELSEWISTILDAMAASVETSEVISSEEMLALVDELNSLLEEEGVPEEGLCVGSLDVKAL